LLISAKSFFIPVGAGPAEELNVRQLCFPKQKILLENISFYLKSTIEG
jgi:hypothetical protein